MTRQLTPGRDDSEHPRLRIGSNSVLAADRGGDLGVRPGESDPGRMLSGVLLLAATTIVMVLLLVGWLF